MTEGNIWKLLIVFSIPLILGNLLQQMYNTADSIIVGNFVGSNGLAAVGSGTALINLIIAFSQGAAVGAGVIVSQSLGARDKQKTKLAVHTAVCIAIILGVILSTIGVIFSHDLLVWMKTPKSVLKDSVLYLQIYCGGLIFNVIYNMATGILNAAGNSKRPLIYLAIASVTNIILDLVFIKELKWGVKGAAIATDISQALSCVLAIGYLLRVNSDYKLIIKELKIHGNTAKQIIRVGLPTAIQNMVISFSNVLVQSSVNSYGAAAMAGYAA
ncbi:MAG: MATE family efflux transporter, partial [Clostridia bacterium]|nr:MATE family efflux transporter [Clostridia bacterium]